MRAVARCFGELATGARTLGLTDRTLDELTAPGVPPADGWGDLVWHTDIRLFDDPREQSLRTAVYRCLGIQPRTPHRNG